MKPIITIPIIFTCIASLYAQKPESKISINLAIELFDAYGAKQNLSNAMKEFAKTYKLQNPSTSTKELDDFISEKNLSELFEQIAKPFVNSFSDDELKYLIMQFKTTAFQKVLRPQGTPEAPLTEEEEKVFSDYRKSETGVKFNREWPNIRNEITNISKQWIIDATIRAQKPNSSKQIKKQ